MDFTNLIIIALFIETVVNWLKPLWDKSAPKMTVAELVSICIGVAIAIVAKINMMDSFIHTTNLIILYIFYACTGVGIGRGPSALYDAWKKFKAQQAAK